MTDHQLREAVAATLAETGLAFHPLANAFPLIEGREFDDLVADIKAHGVREPIWLYGGMILDGRNRYRAAAAAGVDCPMQTYDGDDPAAFVVSMNLRRRHLDESQRAMAAANLGNMPVGRPSANSANLRISQGEAAKLLNVSERSVSNAARVIEQGAPELIAAVEQGTSSVSAAADVATLPKEEQAEIVARGEKAILEAAKHVRAERSLRPPPIPAEAEEADEETNEVGEAIMEAVHRLDGRTPTLDRLYEEIKANPQPFRDEADAWQRAMEHWKNFALLIHKVGLSLELLAQDEANWAYDRQSFPMNYQALETANWTAHAIIKLYERLHPGHAAGSGHTGRTINHDDGEEPAP